MKPAFFITIAAATLVAVASCKSKAQKDAEKYMSKIQETMKENSPAATDDQQKTNSGSATMPQGMENIVGEWELIKVVPDANGNHILDAEEEKDTITTMKDYLKLNANGTCEYTIAKMEGTYKIVTTDDGKKRLIMYDAVGTETTRSRYIISVTKTELVINRLMGGSDFEVFKRL